MAFNPASWDASPDGVVGALEEHRARRNAIDQLGLRPLSPALRLLLWSLRGYVLFMLIVVAVNVVENLH